MRKSLAALMVCAVLAGAGCSSSSGTSDTVSQPSDELDSTTADDSASEEAIAACSQGQPVTGRTVKVVASVSPITNLVSLVASGTDIEVTGLVPEGTNSHTFEPPPSAAKVISEADGIFINGLGLEDPILELTDANKKSSAILCEVGTAALPRSEWVFDESFPEEGGVPNPHVWTNPPHVLRYVTYIRDALLALSPADADILDANYVKVSRLVTALDDAMTVATETVPVRNRKLLTYHDSFAYFARHFGFDVVGAIQPRSFSEPTPVDVANIISQVKSEDVPAIFGSEVFPSPVLEQIGKEAGVRYVDSLRDDDLPGKPGDPDHSWAGLMKIDFITMIEALGGDASAVKAVNVNPGLADRAVYPQ